MKQTHTLIKRLVALVGNGTVAKACGKESQTVDAWGRPPLSNEHPSGTGKANPFDCTKRLQNLAHEGGDDALAQEIAELFTDNANTLVGKTITHAGRDTLIGAAVKETAEAVVACLNGESPDFTKAHTEIVQAEVALRKLKIYVLDEMKHPSVRPLAPPAEVRAFSKGGGRE